MSETSNCTDSTCTRGGTPTAFWIALGVVAAAAAVSPRIFDRIWSRHH
ncbi:MAG: hypothetical protein ACTH1Z_08340 [Ancrocorticia sp.]